MPDAARLRDSTQILIPPESTVDGIVHDLEERFTVTVRDEDAQIRVIGSPTEIKAASDFLARNGIAVA
ncbi:MAG: hypothetical protein ABEI96_00495 [Haloarculaceae archaeon]